MKRVVLFLTMAFFSLSASATEDKEDVFWSWFQKNEKRIYTFEKDQERTFDDLAAAMHKVHADLTFEFGPVLGDGRREFVISAGGIKNAFPAVESLCAKAPKMEKWIVVKFRSRRTPINDIEISGRTVRAAEVRYVLFRDEHPDKVGIMLFFDGYNEKHRPTFSQMGYLFLDEALGEYDVEMKLGAIVFQGRDSKYFEKSHPLAELPGDFDGYFKRQKK